MARSSIFAAPLTLLASRVPMGLTLQMRATNDIQGEIPHATPSDANSGARFRPTRCTMAACSDGRRCTPLAPPLDGDELARVDSGVDLPRPRDLLLRILD